MAYLAVVGEQLTQAKCGSHISESHVSSRLDPAIGTSRLAGRKQLNRSLSGPVCNQLIGHPDLSPVRSHKAVIGKLSRDAVEFQRSVNRSLNSCALHAGTPAERSFVFGVTAQSITHWICDIPLERNGPMSVPSDLFAA